MDDGDYWGSDEAAPSGSGAYRARDRSASVRC